MCMRNMTRILSCSNLNFNSVLVYYTLIMHQYRTIRNIIRMKVLNFKVVYGYRAFQQFMLYLLNDDILFPYLSATGL